MKEYGKNTQEILSENEKHVNVVTNFKNFI